MSHLRSSESCENDCADSKNSPKGLFNRFRSFNRSRYPVNNSAHPHEFRFYSRKAMESRDITLDHARAKQFVFAAVLLSQFCQVKIS
ncbi:unnamed protein product [Gongylonema pulchrum]|uniref:Uncharacterized protein n=1 Tax=Gongylonema pulchrum TaxID=637853 RepID=A0A183F0E7_9BILA|nr:unnamed protein product [Gongylonema pulchrum]